MFAFGCFTKFFEELPRIERQSFDMPITIGILICDLRQQYCRENILNYMNHFNRFSDEYINFYIPGYCSDEEMRLLRDNGYDRYYMDSYNLRGKDYYFSEVYFDEFVFKLRENFNIQYQGVPELILVEVYEGHVNWDRKMRFLLSILQQKGQIDTVYNFFNKIFDISKEYVDIDDISKVARQDKLGESLFEIIKNNIPSYAVKLYENDKIYRLK